MVMHDVISITQEVDSNQNTDSGKENVEGRRDQGTGAETEAGVVVHLGKQS